LPAPGPLKSRFSHLPRIFARAALLLVPVILLGTFLTLSIVRHGSFELSQSSPSSIAPNWQGALDLSSNSLLPRPVFPYSIVPGGVRNAQELQKAASADPVVARHYSDFRIAKSRTIQLNRPLSMYVSYRRNNQVFWTKRPMLIPAGEALISDGDNLARVRCGNRLSPIAAKPVAETDPAEEELSEPSFVPPLLAELFPGEGNEMFAGGPVGAAPVPLFGPLSGPRRDSGPPPFLPPFLGPGVPPSIPSSNSAPPPISTPEPGSFSLLLCGAAFIFLFVLLSLRRAGSS
jgi:hypothetical protein